MRAEVAAVVPEAYAETSWGTPALDIGAGVARPAAPPPGVEVVDASPLHARGRRPLLLPPRGRRAPAGSPAWSSGAAVSDAATRRRDEIAGDLDARSREPDRRPPAPRPAAPRDEVTLDRGDQVLPGLRRTPARRARGAATWGRTGTRRPRPRRAECADLDLRWHFIGGLQSNKAAAVAALRRRGRSPSTAPSCCRACRGRRTSATATLDVLVQVSLDPTRGERGRAGRRRPGRRRRRSPSRSPPPRGCGCAA